MSVIDAHEVVRNYLSTVTGLTDLVQSRIFAGADLEKGYTPSDGPAVVFSARSGNVAYHGATLRPSMQFRCFGKTRTDAGDTDRALYDALHEQSGPSMRWATLETMGQPLTDPDTGWFFMLSGYRIWLADTP